MVIYYFFIIMMIFISVVFVTLLERKVLGLIQFRLGPNKVIFKGVLQSLGDAIKLMSKDNILFFFSSLVEYNFLPLGMLFMMMSMWCVVPGGLVDYSNNLLMILCIMSASVYPIMFGSWFSGSLYSMMGAIRSIAQMVSYEVSMIMIILSMVILPKSFNLYNFAGSGGYVGAFLLFIIIIYLLFCSFVVELGRTPADLVEGESELVSGFNTEYFGLKFSLIFLSEYGMIMFMGGLLGCLGGGLTLFGFSWGIFTMIHIMLILWIRGILPRIRYDKLMVICWISVLNLSLGFLFISVGFMTNL